MTADTLFATPVDIMMKNLQKRDGSSRSSETGANSMEAVPTSSPPEERCLHDDCTRSFPTEQSLKRHQLVHKGNKPYKCDWNGCGREFSQPGNFKTHTRLHTGERPFKCKVCGACFPNGGNLSAHQTTHSNARPFKCVLGGCSTAFKVRGSLKNHQNKFHKKTISEFVERFTAVTDVDKLLPRDRELARYFSSIYKNSNKGIKGRGRGRCVSDVRMGNTKPSSPGMGLL
ncbi:hypothetical protein ACHAQH_009180 [Verticillium albo-atrum]